MDWRAIWSNVNKFYNSHIEPYVTSEGRKKRFEDAVRQSSLYQQLEAGLSVRTESISTIEEFTEEMPAPDLTPEKRIELEGTINALTTEKETLEKKLAAKTKVAENNAAMAKAQRLKAKTLVRENMACRSAFDAVPVPLVMMAHDRSITLANAAFMDALGYDPRELDGLKETTYIDRFVSNTHNLRRFSALTEFFRPLPEIPLSFEIPFKVRAADPEYSRGKNVCLGTGKYRIALANVVINEKGEFVTSYILLGNEMTERDVKHRAAAYERQRDITVRTPEIIEFKDAEILTTGLINAYAFDFKDEKPSAEPAASFTVDMAGAKELLPDALYALRQMYMFCQSEYGRQIDMKFVNVPELMVHMMKGADIALVEQAAPTTAGYFARKPKGKIFESVPIKEPLPILGW